MSWARRALGILSGSYGMASSLWQAKGWGTSRPSCLAGHRLGRAPWCQASGLCGLDTPPRAPKAAQALKASCHMPSSAKVPNRCLHLTLTSRHKITPVSATAAPQHPESCSTGPIPQEPPFLRGPEPCRETLEDSSEFPGGWTGAQERQLPQGLSAGPLRPGGAAGRGAPSHLSQLRGPTTQAVREGTVLMFRGRSLSSNQPKSCPPHYHRAKQNLPRKAWPHQLAWQNVCGPHLSCDMSSNM